MKLFFITTFLITCTWAFTPNTRTASIKQRVIGGQNAASGQFPFAAAINITTRNGRYFCGGTLVNSEWIITAGQCVDDAVIFNIQLGSTSLDISDSNRVVVATSDFILHPEFHLATLQNDIGLIKLRLPVEFTNYILAVHSLSSSDLSSNSRVVVLGWGQTSDEDPGLSNHLQYVAVTVLTKAECQVTYGNQITDNMLCVDGNYNEGICTGDTGSSLVRVIALGNAELVGVASFMSGNGCESTDPSGYSGIYPYRNWIGNVTNT